ncbi:MAG TPA: zf-TFIIB domain-containing protein [Streptosporangiaceae bacterium]|jgi:Zn-finger nucleic acid-binding protein
MSEAPLTCPKCSGKWETLRKNGVVIERCATCEGVFLDRGELERLIDAESAYLANLPQNADPDTTYHGRHRDGVVAQLFGSDSPGD